MLSGCHLRTLEDIKGMLVRYRPRLGIFNTRVYQPTRASCFSESATIFSSSSLACKYSPRLAAVLRDLSQPYLKCTYILSHSSRTVSTMATATKIHLSPATDAGIYSSKVTDEGARTASEVLQDDMKRHHVFFNEKGFHSMYLFLCSAWHSSTR